MIREIQANTLGVVWDLQYDLPGKGEVHHNSSNDAWESSANPNCDVLLQVIQDPKQ